MVTTKRPIAFVLAATNHGTMIVNRHDYHGEGANAYGVGWKLLNTSSFDQTEVDLAVALLSHRRALAGDGVVAIDCGANIGVHTVEWARCMHGWGRVLAFEAQERIYYALAGNLAVNNCLDASARLAAVGAECARLRIPVPNYFAPASFGSLELKQRANNEFIGQPIDYSDARMTTVDQVSVDSLDLPRVDFMKIDVEGMELEVLAGAAQTIARCHPVMLIEYIKADQDSLAAFLGDCGYAFFVIGMNLLAVHSGDPLHARIRVENNQLHVG